MITDLPLINDNKRHRQLDPSNITTRTKETDKTIGTACELSNTIFEALLSEAETSMVLAVQESQSSLREDVAVQPIRLAFLWSPSCGTRSRLLQHSTHAGPPICGSYYSD
jgi:hypothetical protein